MTDILIFDEFAQKAPIWWSNFLKHHNANLASEFDLNNWLQPFNAVFYTTKDAKWGYGERRLKFNDESDITYFILRWS